MASYSSGSGVASGQPPVGAVVQLHGPAPLIAQDAPQSSQGDRLTRKRYDVVLFQEDFEYHSIIRRQMEDSVGVAGNGLVFDLRRLAAQILLAPVAAVLPHFSVPYRRGPVDIRQVSPGTAQRRRPRAV